MRVFQRFKRLWQIGKTARRYGLDADLKPYLKFRYTPQLMQLFFGSIDHSLDIPFAVRLRQALEDLGPIFVKFGQIMSTRPDIFPQDVIEELKQLQDKVPPFSSAKARAIVEKSLSCSIDEVFSSFDDVAIASASVAQVHHAVLQDGQDVVVKVLRPGVNEAIDRDVAVMQLLAGMFRTLWPKAGNYSPTEAVESYGQTMKNSLDLMIEAANANRFRMRFEESEILYVPRVHWNYSRADVIVLERVSGIPIREIDSLKQAGVDLCALADNLVSCFFMQAFYDGFFHGDLHPGNIFVSESGQINIVDFGIMGNLTEVDRSYLAENIMAILQRDYQASAQSHIRAGWAPPDLPVQQFEVRIRTVCEQVINQPVGQASFGELIGRLFRMTREFGINMQPQLLLFQKTYLNLEGLVRTLDPNFDISGSIRPVLESWMRQRYSVGRLAENLKHESSDWISVAPQIPGLVHRVLSSMEDRQNRDRASGGLSPHQEKFYRRIFFTIIGSVSMVGAIVHWSDSGFGFLTLALAAVALVCLKSAWPR